MSDPLRNHLAGAAAEEQVARHYERAGHSVIATRWRGQGGEIDLIVKAGGTLVFVEVKRARTHDAAALRITPRQVARITAAAAEFLATRPEGARTDTRFDAALLDGTGRIEIREAAFP